MAQDLLTETVRLLRKRKGLSQRDIAAGTGVSQKWVSLLENGKALNPSYTNLVKVRDFLKSRRIPHQARAA